MTELRRFDVEGDGSTTFRGQLGTGEVAFVDAAVTSGSSCWARVYPPGADDPTQDAARAVVRAARGALAELADLAPHEVSVVGDGVLARLVRHRLGSGAVEHEGAPVAVIDAAGTAQAIAAATSAAANGGRVVLAAVPLADDVDVRTYGDVHARGLTIIGVRDDDGPVSPDDVDWVLSHLADAVLGRPAEPRPWYRVVAGTA